MVLSYEPGAGPTLVSLYRRYGAGEWNPSPFGASPILVSPALGTELVSGRTLFILLYHVRGLAP